MSACYLCGHKDSHTNDCPNFKPYVAVPAPAIPIVTFKIQNKIWRIDVIKPGDTVPMWVTHAWYIELASKTLTLQQRADEWERYCDQRRKPEPIHTLSQKNLKVGDVYRPGSESCLHSDWDLIVFGPI